MLAKIIHYFREAFCRHEFEFSEGAWKEKYGDGGYRHGTRVGATCTKCAFHKSFWKLWS